VYHQTIFRFVEAFLAVFLMSTSGYELSNLRRVSNVSPVVSMLTDLYTKVNERLF